MPRKPKKAKEWEPHYVEAAPGDMIVLPMVPCPPISEFDLTAYALAPRVQPKKKPRAKK